MSCEAFRPVPWLPGADLQTIVPALWPHPRRGPWDEVRVVEVASGTAVRVEIDRPARAPTATLLLVHGMGGSARSVHVLRTASEALARGWIVARMNLRNCGGTEDLSRTLYNAGQSDDVGRVLEALDDLPHPLFAAGFSLGGSLVLRQAGRAGPDCAADAVAAVNPPVDLAACADALERPRNRLYQIYYTRQLCRLLHGIALRRELPAPPPRPNRVRTVRRFDALYTAPDAGYPDVATYYREASAGPYLDAIERPALVVSAANDPIVPLSMFLRHHGVPRLRFVHPARGGHCGYWQRGQTRCWAAAALVEFLAASGGRRTAHDRPPRPA